MISGEKKLEKKSNCKGLECSAWCALGVRRKVVWIERRETERNDRR
jgi:hypothetical protein